MLAQHRCKLNAEVRMKDFYLVRAAEAVVKRIIILCLALLCSYALAADTFADAKAGQQVAAMCAACHQANGAGMNIPGGEA